MTDRLEELVERDSDGALTPAEAVELAGLLAHLPHRVAAVAQRRMALLLAAYLGRSAATLAKMAQAVEGAAVDQAHSSALHMAHTALAHPQPPSASWHLRRWAAAALVVVLIGALVAVSIRVQPGFAVVAARGGITVGGRPVGGGSRLAMGSTVTVAAYAQATLRIDDGSMIELMGGSRLMVTEDQGIVLHLEQGALSADFRHQPLGRPLRIIGPRALCTVLGTRLAFDVAADHDRLQVIEGLVRAERPSDQLAVDIPGGETVDIAASGSLLPRPSAGGGAGNHPPRAKRQGSSLYNPHEVYAADLPLFPVTYSEEQKREQRAAGLALVKEAREAARGGKPDYRAKPGVYRLPKGADFEFNGVGTFALHLPDCELILDSVEDRSLFKFGKTASFTLTGPVKVDFDPLPESQGRITAADTATRQLTVAVMPGYHALAVGKKEKEILHAFTPQGVRLPDPGYPEFAWKDAKLSADGRTMTVLMGKDLKPDYWDMLYRPGNLVSVGNAGCGALFCIWPDQLGELVVEDLDFYGGGFGWGNATGNSTLTRVRGLRRPGTNRLQGGGGWQSGKRQGRVVFESCEFRTTNDDILDLSSGSMDMVWKQESPRSCLIWTWSGHHVDLDPAGSSFCFYHRDFAPIADARLVSAERIPDEQARPWLLPAAQLVKSALDFKQFTDGRAFWRLTFDHDLALEPGNLVEDVANRQMEVVMRNCTWYDCGMRVMVQSGRRIEITNNHFVRITAGLHACTDAWWWQGETVHDVLIADNVFIATSYGNIWNSGKAAISVHNGTKPIAGFPGRYPHSDIVIRDNLIQDAGSGAIIVQNADHVHITGNECHGLFRSKEGPAAIAISGCGRVEVSGNRIDGCPVAMILAEWVEGLECRGNSATDLGSPAKPVAAVVLDHVRTATLTDNHAARAHLEALVRLGNSSGVELGRNSSGDAPATPALVEGAGNSDIHGRP